MIFRLVRPGLQVRPALMLHAVGPPVKADGHPEAGARTHDRKVTIWLNVGFENYKAKDYAAIIPFIFVLRIR